MVGPTITVPAIKPGQPLRILGYGDTRFTATTNVKDTNPRMRQFLVQKIAEVHPDAIFETGDLPWRGAEASDWKEFRDETKVWRDKHLRLYPTLGNHEVLGGFDQGIANYLAEFPDLKGCRYYSVLLGNVYLLSIDYFEEVKSGDRQREWIESQIEHLPAGVDFVFFIDHMPLMADLQSQIAVDLPERGEIDLRGVIEEEKSRTRARFIVLNGHIHNYERFERKGISYIITGGGGAKPYPVLVRGEEDLYRLQTYPNYNYVLFEINGGHLQGTMYRVDDPRSAKPKMEARDQFFIDAQP